MKESSLSYKFPNDNWLYDGSYSYGADELYSGTMHVVVKIFPEEDRELAYATYFFLLDNKITTATIKQIQHVTDQKNYYYVFAERNDFLAQKEKLFPDIKIEKRKTKTLINTIIDLVKEKLMTRKSQRRNERT